MSGDEEIAAVIKSTFLGFEDHGIFTASIDLTCVDGCSQGAGNYQMSHRPMGSTVVISPGVGEFVAGVLRAVGVDSWEKLVGRHVIAIRRGGMVRGFKPAFGAVGEAFDFDAWSQRQKDRRIVEA